MASVGVFRLDRSKKVESTINRDRERQLHEGPTTCLYELDSREETIGRAADIHLGEVQPSWNLQ